MPDFKTLRERMVERQIAARGLTRPRLLAAFRVVPREAFVSPDYAAAAYEDSPLPIESQQTISQPYIVALMIDAAEISPGDRVLEIGAGSGYAAAVIGQIAEEVIAVERHEELARIAAERMERLGYDNVHIVHADGSGGLPEKAPFDAILAAATGRNVPQILCEQLNPRGGILVMPVGQPGAIQQLVKVTRQGAEEFEREDLGPVRFVPLVGREGWSEEEGR